MTISSSEDVKLPWAERLSWTMLSNNYVPCVMHGAVLRLRTIHAVKHDPAKEFLF